MEVFLPALLVGLLGSMHCIGMCGPLALAVPHLSDKKSGMALESLIYNFGRILTYIILGMIFGALGSTIRIAGYQSSLSIIMGAGLLLVYFFPSKLKSKFTKYSFLNKFNIFFKKAFQKFIGIKSVSSLFLTGLLNGLLPCGLVYVALTGAVANAKITEGALYMLSFGLGTLPVMFTVYFSKGIVTPKVRFRISRLIPFGVAVIGILLILRGLSLGIPYISPVLETINELPPCCR